MTPRPPPPAARTALLGWFADSARVYPWRQTTDPYAVLVSEMMLQQTRVKSVLGRGYYARWMERFPDVRSLAEADEAEVLRLWEGLGYYTRARNLLKSARAVMAGHHGKFPRAVADLEALPGIGPYTARAVAAFAYDAPVAVVDANVCRVIARLIDFRDPVDSGDGPGIIHATTQALVPASGGRAMGSALMELGQRICLPRQPDCEICPVARWCRSKSHRPETLPVKRPGKAIVRIEEQVIWQVRNAKLLLHRESGRRRHGLWKLPDRAAAEVAGWQVVHDSVYTITHHRVRLLVHRAPPRAPTREGETWIPLGELAAHPMPAPFRKVVDALT